MRRIPVILDLLAVGVPLVAGMAGGGSGSRGGYGRGDYGDQSATTADPGASGGGGGVRIAGFAFAPKAGSAGVSQKVTWRDQDASAIHTITALDGSFGSGQLEEGDSFSHVFRRAGTFAYHCSIHPSMRGTVKVSG